MKSLITNYHDWVKRYLGSNSPACKATTGFYGITPAARYQCDLLIFGSLTRFPTMHGYWPSFPDPFDVKKSIQAIVQECEAIKFTVFLNDTGLNGQGAHEVCNISNAFKESFQQILKEAPSPVLSSHVNHLATQKSKCQVSSVR